MKLSIFLSFTFIITLQLAASSSSYQPLKGKWVFSRFLEFNNSACCAFNNLTFTTDPSSNRDDLFANFIADSRFTENCQWLFGDYQNGFKVSASSSRGSSSTRYIPKGDKYDRTLSASYEIDDRNDKDGNTLVVKADVYDNLKWPPWVDCNYVMTRVEEEGPGFLASFADVAPWKLGFGAIILIVCLGLVCTKTEYKASPMALQEGSVQSYQNPQQYGGYQQQPQADIYYNQQRNVY